MDMVAPVQQGNWNDWRSRDLILDCAIDTKSR